MMPLKQMPLKHRYRITEGHGMASGDHTHDHGHQDDHPHPHPHTDQADSGRDHNHDHPHPHGHDHGAGHGSVWARLWHQLSHVVTPHSHDAADKVDAAMEASRDGMRALWISLAVLGATAVMQAVVTAFSGSVALLGDTLHN